MLLALSTASSQGIWMLCNNEATKIIDSICWTDGESTGLSQQIYSMLDRLLTQNPTSKHQINKIFCASGPGAFTGLRMGCAFAQGFARSLNIDLSTIPTSDLSDVEFYIPLRHQLAKNLTLEQCHEQKIEFLKISKSQNHEIKTPDSELCVWGTSKKPNWPSAENLLKGVQTNLNKKSDSIKIIYGLEAKISGKWPAV